MGMNRFVAACESGVAAPVFAAGVENVHTVPSTPRGRGLLSLAELSGSGHSEIEGY
jgi:hypothetical protein